MVSRLKNVPQQNNLMLNLHTGHLADALLASEFTLSFSRPKHKQLGEEMRQWFSVVCVCVLFWPKARKILATATINIMNFLYFTTRMLPKRKNQTKLQRTVAFCRRTFKPAIKIKGFNDGSLEADLPRSLVRLNGVVENQTTTVRLLLAATFRNG